MDAQNPWKEQRQRSKALAVSRLIWTNLDVEVVAERVQEERHWRSLDERAS